MRGEFESVPEARVIPFRRRANAPKRKRRSVWLRLLAPLGAAFAAVATPCGAVVWVLHSSRFALAAVDVEAQRTAEAAGSQASSLPRGPVTTSWVAAALQPLVGRNLPSLDLAEVEARLAGHPWIGAVEARKELPRRLVVRFRARVPVAILQSGATLFYLDERGAVIAPVEPGGSDAPAGELFFVRLPVSRGEGGAPPATLALRVAAEFRQADAAWGKGLSEVEVLSDDDCRVVTEGLPFPVLVKAGGIAAGLTRLRALLPEIERRYAAIQAVDLRSTRRVVIQPDIESHEVNERRPPAETTASLASMRRNF